MILGYAIKHNGIFYPIGTDVPLEETPGESLTEKVEKVEPIKEEPKKDESVAETTTKTKLTKTEINRMSTADLKKLAIENGIDGSLSGSEIKKILISKL